MTNPTHTAWDDAGQLEVLSFSIGEERLAVEAMMIREILDMLPQTRVPGAAPLVDSVVNFRGKIIPIADLRIAFGMPVEEATLDSRIVVIETAIDGELTTIGLYTDKVHEVATLDQGDSSEPPAVGVRWRRDYVREFVRQQDGVTILPDLDAIFSSFVSNSTSVSNTTSPSTH
ncbi:MULTISPECIES: chemotaxis protein CheW [unclassified Novosphingobium]|uniref:chemotaxis protein CheW n=1 Tax=unclassified Novosphingobium TaxID=2644732 RepID=UPI0025D0AFFB|nr:MULTISPECIES: chemotaxis protein CheW [unclassified Novosphingobium]HQS68730.1 chemotaxis protein CheW [Novosphingobium sp.]